jgi:PKD repeat protein
VIWNANLSITSQVATLTLTNTPVITAQPQPSTRHGCDTNTFSISAFANCPLTYQWYFQSTNLLTGATQSALSINGVQPSDAGDYFVMVSTPFAGVPSQSARLTVQTDPVIIQAPSAVTNRECDIVNLQVLVGAEPPCSWLTYQWQLEGTNLPAATNRVYSFEATAETAGNYQVVVGNRWTNRIVGPARVTVDVQPRIVQQPPPSLRFREGDAFTNTISVQSCSAMTYQWQYKPLTGTNFSNLFPDARHVVSTNGWLIVSNSQTNDSGYYRVFASNIFTGITSAVSLVRVVHPPGNDNFVNAYTLGWTNQASALGYNEYATAEPGEPNHGLQPPNHSVWWVWTNPFPSLVTVDLGGSDIDTLLGVYTGASVSNLTTIAEDDNGGTNGRSRVSFMAGGGKPLYFAVDGKNNAEGTNLVISVNAFPITSPPVITEQPLNLAATAGQTVTFTNRAYGSPDMSIQWFGQGTSRAAVTTIYPLTSPTNYLSTLTLTKVSTNDDGVYYVVLTNSFGSVTSKLATLTFGSIVRGMVTDATRTSPDGSAVGLPGVLISVGDASTYTDESGNYELVGVKLGSLRANFMANKTRVHLSEGVQFWNLSTSTANLLTATTNGFYDYTDDQFEVGQGQTVAKRFSMSPIFSGLRFVLNWTNTPADLDLLLHLPPSVPVAYPWIDYLPTNRGSMTQPPYAILDVDSANGWGPETITIHSFYPGTYSLYANKFQGQGGTTLSQSAARVVAYVGGDVIGPSPQLRPYGSLRVPTLGTNTWWHICDIDGSTTNINWLNELLPTPPGGVITNSAAPTSLARLDPSPMPAPKDEPKSISAYEWNFCDGSPVSNLYEPVHAYAEPGWKTVSLKVMDTSGSPPKSDTMIKTNYIYVENLPPIVMVTNPLPDTVFRAGDPITLQSAADGIDDAIQQVDYYIIASGSTNYLGAISNAPYTLVFSTTNFVDSTIVFVALAHDVHGATAWSEPVTVRIVDLRGDILFIRNFPSPEIDEMVGDLDLPFIPDRDPSGNRFQRSPVVKVLDQEGLYFGLVQGFKLIIWDDQGRTEAGLTDNDVGVLKQAYDAGIPVYLIGEKLSESRDFLTGVQEFSDWTALLGFQRIGSIPGPLTMQGIQATYEDCLFLGWYPFAEASTSIPTASTLEWIQLISSDFDVVADITVPGLVTNGPIMLRFPQFSQPDFGQTRRLVQDFRVTLGIDPLPPEDAASHDDRKTLFINGVTWLLRLCECQDLNIGLECVQPPIPSGRIGEPITFITMLNQNGACTAGGILVTNHLSSHLQPVSAEVVPAAVGTPTNNYQVAISSNTVVASFALLPRNSLYELRTVAIPRKSGWLTNNYTVVRGLYEETPCSQVAFIEGPTCNGPFYLSTSLDTNRVLHLSVSGASGCPMQIQTSTDLRNWVDLVQIQPDGEPYDVRIGPVSVASRFYRLHKWDGPTCSAVRLSPRLDTNNNVHLTVSGGGACAFQVEFSTDLRNWTNLIQIQPDAEPYDALIGPAPAASGFYRLRKLD